MASVKDDKEEYYVRRELEWHRKQLVAGSLGQAAVDPARIRKKIRRNRHRGWFIPPVHQAARPVRYDGDAWIDCDTVLFYARGVTCMWPEMKRLVTNRLAPIKEELLITVQGRW